MNFTSSSFRHKYHQTFPYWITMCGRDWYPKDMNGVAKMEDFREPIGIMKNDCEQSLDRIKKLDTITLGIPKIVFMVGWQKGGHDAQYPAWGPIERRIKRPEDATALDSFVWLFHEAKKYNTTVSVHINMIDAHPFSPLWDLYYKYDIIAKNKDGSLRPYVWGYPISYTREWNLGFAQRRIDMLCELLPVQEAGILKIDAFHSFIPLLEDQSCISPYLGISAEEEAETQKKIISYFRTKGIDVAAEFNTEFRVDSLIGLQPMTTYFKDIDFMRIPASMYCGGDGGDPRVGFNLDRHIFYKLIEEPDMDGLAGEMVKSTFIWHYLNRLDRLSVDDKGAVLFEGGVKSWIENLQPVSTAGGKYKPPQPSGDYYIKKGDDFIRDKGDVFVPALWREKTIAAHSDLGYKKRKWALPEDWPESGIAKINKISTGGVTQIGETDIVSRSVILSLDPGQTVSITI